VKVGKQENIARIIVETLSKIISDQGYTGQEAASLLSKAEKLVGLAMAGHNSPSNPEDRRRADEVIRE
jgi:hypothetical protein